MVGWGTCVHGRLPLPNLLFSIFSPIFLHLKLSHFTRECLEESLPHVRDFSMSQTPTSKPLLQLLAMFFMQIRGRPTTLFFESNAIFLTLRTLMKWLCKGLQEFFPLRGIVRFFLAYPFSFPLSSCVGLDFTLHLVPCTLSFQLHYYVYNHGTPF